MDPGVKGVFEKIRENYRDPPQPFIFCRRGFSLRQSCEIEDVESSLTAFRLPDF